MDNFIILNIQVFLSLLVYYLLFRFYLQEKLARLDFEQAMIPLLFLHAFRFLGFTFLVEGQIDPAIPESVTVPIAYGDLLVSVLAIVTIIALKNRWSLARLLVWGVNILGFVDMLNALRLGFGVEFYKNDLEGIYYLLILMIPALMISHIYMFSRLLKKN